MNSLLGFYSALNKLWIDQQKAMSALQLEATFSRSISPEVWEDNRKALKDNHDTEDELIAHFDIDSTEYAIRNQIPF